MALSSKLVLAFGLLAAVLLPGAPASAATSVPTGISVSPFLQQLNIEPGESGKSYSVTITNRTQAVQEIKLSAQDFGSLNNSGGVVLEGTNAYTQKYGLVSWLSLETDTVVLNPGESQSVLVTIDNRQSLQPGGHYAAVVATVGQPDPNPQQVALNQRLLSLLLVDKVGGEHYDLKLKDVSANGNWFRYPNDIKLHFQNPGNVHVIPRGLVKLVNPDGTVVSQGIINDGSAFMLPESYRDYYVPLKTVGHAYPWPGLYRIQVEYRYDGLDRYAVQWHNTNFIDLGLYMVVGVLLAGFAWAVKRRFWHVSDDPTQQG